MFYDQNYKQLYSSSSLSPMSKIVKRLRVAMFSCLGILIVLNFFIRPHEPHFVIDGIPGFWALFGLVVAVVLGLIAKGAAHAFLGKIEDFWT